MAKKDFWFPFYFERFLSSVNGWDDSQIGAYLMLLIYQFQNGSIPNNMKVISRISPSAKKHWWLISKKFKEREEGLYNEVMDEIRHSRMNQIETASENGKRGGRPKQKQTETETQPLTQTPTLTENNINIHIDKENKEGLRQGIAWDMIEAFKQRFPHYWIDQEKDPMAVMQIANKIADQKGFQKHEIILVKRPEILKEWVKYIDFAASDNWFSKRSISDLNREWQRLLQSFVPVIPVKNIPSVSFREREGADLLDEIEKRFKNGTKNQ